MELHGNARLTPHGRTLMCQRVRHDGWTVAEAAEARIDHSDLTALLYLQGYRREEFVEPK